MTIQDEVEALRRIPLFSGVDLSKLKLLAFASERVAFPEGRALFREGDPGDAAYLILDGAAEVTVASETGPVTVATIGKDAFVGEIAILTDVPRTATVVAATPVEALRIRKDVFLQLLRDVPMMAIEVMREMAERLDRTTDHLRAATARLRAAGLAP